MEAGLITPDTEYALFDQFNFSIGSDQLSPEDLYWVWVTTQALAQWPGFMEEGCLRRWSGEQIGLAEGIERLLAFNRPPLAEEDRRLELLAVPAGAEAVDGGHRVTVDPEVCFCSLHQLGERSRGGGPLDTCLLSGDVLAAALACYCALPVAADQVTSSVHSPGESCTFMLRQEPLGWEIQRRFVEEIDAAREEYRATVRERLAGAEALPDRVPA
jgi:hypothetical protein